VRHALGASAAWLVDVLLPAFRCTAGMVTGDGVPKSSSGGMHRARRLQHRFTVSPTANACYRRSLERSAPLSALQVQFRTVAAPSELTSLTRSAQEASRVRIEDTLLDGLDDLIDEQTANGEVSYGGACPE